MRTQRFAASFFALVLMQFLTFCLVHAAGAQEVEKGKIPPEHLAPTYKALPWGPAIWDVPEAVTHLKPEEKVLWVDTRPESFFKQGTVNGAVLLVYDKKGVPDNTLSAAALEKALADHGWSKDNATVAFFCQGPECHRSYNAAFTAVSEWGFSPERIVWFRAGYPHLLQEVKTDPKLKRKAKQYLSEDGVKQL